MSITYTPSTNFGSKDSLPSNDPNKVIKGAEFTTEFIAIQSAFGLAAPSSNPTFTGTATFDSVTANAVSLGNVTTSNLTVSGTSTLGVLNAGTTTVGAFTSNGIDDNATSTAITIDANKHVGINYTGGNLDPLRVGLADGEGLCIGTRDQDGTYYLGMKQTTSQWNNAGYLKWEQSGNVNDLTISAGGGDLKFITSNQPYNERMVIDSDGNVGIGEAPASDNILQATKLGQDTIAQLRCSGAQSKNAVLELLATSSNGAQGYAAIKGIGTGGATGQLTFHAGNSTLPEVMRISSAGNVGIGETNPQQALVVKRNNGDVYADVGRATQAQGQVAVALRGGTGGTDWFMYQDASSDNLKFYGNGADRMVIDSTGNVGIGTSNPTHPLTVQDDGAGLTSAIALTHTDSSSNQRGGTLVYNVNNGSAQKNVAFIAGGKTGNTSGGYLALSTADSAWNNPTEAMRIDGEGNVGIGESNPGANLDIKDATKATLRLNHTGSNNSGNLLVGRTSTVNPATDFGTQVYSNGVIYQFAQAVTNSDVHRWHNGNGTKIAYLQGDGDLIISGTYSPSDERLKENIVDAPAGNLDDLRVRSYDWKADGTSVAHGFIAQELEVVAPYAVKHGETEDDMMSVDYTKLVPMLVKEIQDLKTKVEALENA